MWGLRYEYFVINFGVGWNRLEVRELDLLGFLLSLLAWHWNFQCLASRETFFYQAQASFNKICWLRIEIFIVGIFSQGQDNEVIEQLVDIRYGLRSLIQSSEQLGDSLHVCWGQLAIAEDCSTMQVFFEIFCYSFTIFHPHDESVQVRLHEFWMQNVLAC